MSVWHVAGLVVLALVCAVCGVAWLLDRAGKEIDDIKCDIERR